jgi:hypothetical protein
VNIRVVTGALTQAGGALERVGTELHGVQGSLAPSAAEAAGACGFPEAAAGCQAVWGQWSSTLGALGNDVVRLGASVGASASLYTITDQTAMPLTP